VGDRPVEFAFALRREREQGDAALPADVFAAMRGAVASILIIRRGDDVTHDPAGQIQIDPPKTPSKLVGIRNGWHYFSLSGASVIEMI